jgi:trigger factor
MSEETTSQATAPETTETGLAKGEQTVTISDVGPARKSLTIELPAERVAKRLEEEFKKLQDDAALPGFRKGRAPMRLLKKRFEGAIRDDLRGQLISESYSQAVEDHKLEVIGDPDVKNFKDIKLPDSGPLTYVVEVEVAPEVALPSLEGIEVIKPKLEVTDEQIAKEIENLRERNGKMDPIEGEGVQIQPKDYVQGHIKIQAGENAGADAELIFEQPGGFILVNGEDLGHRGHIAGIVVEDLGKRAIAQKTGETLVISTKGPEGHENDKIKNQPITITMKLDKVYRVQPASLESIQSSYGVASEEELKKAVRESSDQRNKIQQTSAQHEQVCNYLVEKVELSLPEGLTGRQTSRLLRRKAMDLSYRGTPEKEIEQRIADMRKTSEDEARKQLKLFFIIDQAARKLEIEVSEDEVNNRISFMAWQQGRRPEKLRQEYIRSGEIESLYLQLREQKTLDKILESAKVTEGEYPKK